MKSSDRTMKRKKDGKTSQGGVNHTYVEFSASLAEVYEELEHCFFVLMFGEGGFLVYETSPRWPIARATLRYMPDIKWPGDGILLKPAMAATKLETVKKYAQRLENDPNLSQSRKDELSLLIANVGQFISPLARLLNISQKLAGRDHHVRCRQSVVRAKAIRMYADFKIYQRSATTEWSRYLNGLHVEAEIAQEKARTAAAEAAMYSAQGRTEEATKAEKRAKRALKKSKEKIAELEKAYAVEKVYADLGRTFQKIPGYIKSVKDNPKKPRQSHSVEQLREVDRRRAKGEKVMSACREVMADKLGREPTEKEVENLRQAYYSWKKRQPPKV